MWWIKKKKPKLTKEQRLIKKLSPSYQRGKVKAELDAVYSTIRRIKGNWTCVKCHRQYEPEIDKDGIPRQKIMTTSHYFGRGDMGGRYDDDNTDPVCIFCHQKIENNKRNTIEGFNYEEYMIQKLGPEGFERLRIKCDSITKYSTFDLTILLQEYKKELYAILGRSR
jgi:hypothetical protein